MNSLTYNIYEFDKSTDISKEIKTLADDINLYNSNEFEKFKKVLSSIVCNYKVIAEHPYVDKNFRDSFYIFHSKKFFEHNRDCTRLLIFEDFDEDKFSSDFSDEYDLDLNNKFIGYMVIQPIYSGLIGTTVINPNYLAGCKGYMCLAKHKCTVFGHQLSALGFLYSSQNSETVTCAELTIIGIVNTLANISTNYRSILPSDIMRDRILTDYERPLPSKGLPYETISRLLCKYTDSSRLYFLDIEDKQNKTEEELEKDEEKRNNFRRIFHTYVESGIPLAVAVKGQTEQNPNIRHSVICIGHGNIDCCWSKKENQKIYAGFCIIESFKGYNKYALIDDNQVPYIIRDFDNLSIYDSSEVVGFAVSLPRSAFLEADEAYFIALDALFNFEDTKMEENMLKKVVNYDKDNNPLVLRVFLVSSAEYKKYKSKTIKSKVLKEHYLNLNLPHYIYVVEISTALQYNENCAFGDIIIDATAANTKYSLDSIINIHYCDRMGSVEFVDNNSLNADQNGERNRWGSFNVYDEIDEVFKTYNTDNSIRRVDYEKKVVI